MAPSFSLLLAMHNRNRLELRPILLVYNVPHPNLCELGSLSAEKSTLICSVVLFMSRLRRVKSI